MSRWFWLAAVVAAWSPVSYGWQASAPQMSSIAGSPPQARAEAAAKYAQANPKSWQAYNDLASALCRWARDTGDLKLYDQAQTAIDQSMKLSPGNYDARKLSVTVLLGKHDFAAALKAAVELNHEVPDDIAGWALLVDVNTALGNYPEAERAAQWILNLRPGSSLGFIKAAGLRDLFGDPQGAAEFYDEAIKRTAQSDLDQRAWLLTLDAHEQLKLGKPQAAEDLLRQAGQLFPASQLRLTELAALRAYQAKSVEAADLRTSR